MKYLIALALIMAAFVFYMDGIESKCLDLGNSPAQCAKL